MVTRLWQKMEEAQAASRAPRTLLRLDETRGLAIVKEIAERPRAGYKKRDKAMARIVGEV
jgi:hypothetical protein